tara:strand:+ start:393 stop:560 length:168 start_codon:yes stop_codon:yes gene_type:complete
MKYYQKLAKKDETFPQIYKRVENDGSYKTTCTDQCPDYLAWVDKGNTAKEVDYTE